MCNLELCFVHGSCNCPGLAGFATNRVGLTRDPAKPAFSSSAGTLHSQLHERPIVVFWCSCPIILWKLGEMKSTYSCHTVHTSTHKSVCRNQKRRVHLELTGYMRCLHSEAQASLNFVGYFCLSACTRDIHIHT